MKLKRTPMRYAHTNGHTSCTYSTSGDHIITCGSDGDIRIWQGIDDDDPSSKCLGEFVVCLLQYDKKLLTSTDLNTVQAHTFPEIERDGTELRFTAMVTTIAGNAEFIAAGSEDTEIRAYRKDKSEGEFQLLGHEGPILAIDVSVNNLLASCSGDGTLKIWNLVEKKEVKTITGLPKCKTFEMVKYFGSPSFHPITGNSLAYANGREIIVLNAQTFEVQFSLNDDSVTSDYSCCAFSGDGKYIAAGTRMGEISVWDYSTKDSINSWESSGTEEAHCITIIVWNPQNNGEFAYCDSTGQLGTVVGCKPGAKESKNDRANDVAMENDMGSDFDGIQFEDDANLGDDDDDDNCVSLEKLKNDTMRMNGVIDDDEGTKDSASSRRRSRSRSPSPERPSVKVFKQQRAFQPSSTPIDLEHRYLVWNSVGIVRAHADSIDVEFHDSSTHHNLHMNNYLNHTMASLSPTVLALCADAATKLVCISLAASSSKEWSVEFPDCEGAVAMAATSKFVAVATDMNFLRIFSVMGTQREVISIPGPVVSMCGHEDKLMICYHSAPATEDQHISAMLLQMFGLTLRTREIRIPLAPNRKLAWVGYSDRGSPVIFDTMGLMQMYSIKTGCWYPICDTMKHSQSVANNFFIVDVSESNQLLQAVLCRGSSYPMTHPRPMVTEVPMQMPLSDIESEKSLLEESLVRCSNFLVDSAEKQVKENALKLFALACRTEMEARAKELIEMIASPALLPLAVKYASKLGRIHLADKLSELLPQLEQQEAEREKEMRNVETDAFSIIQSSPLNASLLLMQKASNKPETPKLAPKPMALGSLKRNPFKKTPNSTPTQSVPRDSVIGELLDKFVDSALRNSQNNSETITQASSVTADESVIGDSQEVTNENQSNNGNVVRESFVAWYAKNKQELASKHPNATDGELTKIGIKEFKTATPTQTQDTVTAVKRKLDQEGGAEKQKFSAKLAKFDFKKQ